MTLNSKRNVNRCELCTKPIHEDAEVCNDCSRALLHLSKPRTSNRVYFDASEVSYESKA